MRLNKYVPFLVAVALHVMPVITLLLMKKSEYSSVSKVEFHGIDLSGFSTTSKKNTITSNSSVNPSIKEHEKASLSEAEVASAVTSTTGSVAMAGQASSNILFAIDPIYPPLARQKGYEGVSKLRAHFDENGVVTSVELLNSSGFKVLDESAKKALYEWKLKSGAAGTFEKTFQFKLNN